MMTLYLEGKVPVGGVQALEEYLARARPFYQAPGGIRVRLQWDAAGPCHFLEIIEYADEQTWAADQARVENDPEMGGWLKQWRALLDGPPTVRTFAEVTISSGAESVAVIGQREGG